MLWKITQVGIALNWFECVLKSDDIMPKSIWLCQPSGSAATLCSRRGLSRGGTFNIRFIANSRKPFWYGGFTPYVTWRLGHKMRLSACRGKSLIHCQYIEWVMCCNECAHECAKHDNSSIQPRDIRAAGFGFPVIRRYSGHRYFQVILIGVTWEQ